MDAAIEWGDYDWVVFTSANGVSYFWQRLEASGAGPAWFARTRVAAIGPETARTLAARGVQPDLVPDEYVAEALVACIADERDLRGARILLPRADIARDALQHGLRDAGALVDCVVAYRTAPAVASPELVAQLRSGTMDVVTFTSSSTVRSLVQMLGGDVAILGNTVVACIGPVTAASARSVGLTPDVVAEQYTIPGLVDALNAYFAAGPEHRAPSERT
jgi:uroporphyrinogen-III synthase